VAGRALPNDPAEATRGILHGAMAVYLSRYLNVPPARLRSCSMPSDDPNILLKTLAPFLVLTPIFLKVSATRVQFGKDDAWL
jgi:hypothetical protein